MLRCRLVALIVALGAAGAAGVRAETGARADNTFHPHVWFADSGDVFADADAK